MAQRRAGANVIVADSAASALDGSPDTMIWRLSSSIAYAEKPWPANATQDVRKRGSEPTL
jgi:hypothetical protein